MSSLTTTTVALAWGFFGALAVIVAAQLLSGGINVHGLLRVKRPGGLAGLSPARVQLFVATLGAAATWLAQALEARDSGRLPDVPTLWLQALGASQGVYLASKVSKFVPILDALRRIIR